MWSGAAVLLCTTFIFVEGGEIFDVTTIYNVGDHCPDQDSQPETGIRNKLLDLRTRSCDKGVEGRIHARTNAMGLPLCDNDNKCISSSNQQFFNITCDSNKNVCSWDTKGWTFSDTASRVYKGTGKVYEIGEQVTLEFSSFQYGWHHIYFTSDPPYTKNPRKMFILRYYNTNDYPVMYYNCYQTKFPSLLQDNCNNRFEDPDGSNNIFCCENTIRPIYFALDNEYVSFHFANGKVKIYRGENNPSLELDWTDPNTDVDIKYFWLSGASFNEVNPTVRVPVITAKDEGSEMVSALFSLESRQLCLTLVLQSDSTMTSQLNILAQDIYQTEHLLSNISLFSMAPNWEVKHVNISLHSKIISPIKLIIRKMGSKEVKIARIASCSPDGEEVEQLPPVPKSDTMPIYTVSSNTLAPVEVLKDSTNSTECLNGGIWTTEGCACPPGFFGPVCQLGCGRNRFGQDCGGMCSLRLLECEGLSLCTNVTGCHCAPGYYGSDCKLKCEPGWYGNDCLQRCGQCQTGSSCDIYTGECAVCQLGFLPPHCRDESVYYTEVPEASSPSYGTITVSFDVTKYTGERPQLYQIQYREKKGEWLTYTNKVVPKDFPVPIGQFLENPPLDIPGNVISEDIGGLKTGVLYQVRVLFLDTNFNKYDGNKVQVAETLTLCDIPELYDYHLKSNSDFTSYSFSWTYVNDSEHWCPVETYEVSWKEGWHWLSDYSYGNFTLTGFLPGSTIKFRVRAKTSGGFAPYSKTILVSTRQNGTSAVRNLRVVSSQASAMQIAWTPPRDSSSNMQYKVFYKCVMQPACPPGCLNASEVQLTQTDTSLTLGSLLPFAQYLVTVTPQDGLESSIYAGTSKEVPTETPSLSELKPIRTNTSLTVFWDQGPVCSSFLQGYHYQLLQESDNLKVLASGFTRDTSVSFHNLTARTDYVVRVFVTTVAGWNAEAFLAIKTSTSATVPEAVQQLTVYKRGRGMLGLRWARPRATYGTLKSFTVKIILGKDEKTQTLQPTPCTVWPDLYCHTIEELKSSRRYNVTVSARNSEVAEDGQEVSTSGVTKESPPSVPEKLKLTNSSSTSVSLQWHHPDMVNGILRSFLVSVEETEKFDQDSCCQVYPLVETAVKEELQTYEAEVSGLHPASTYFVSVSAKTVGLGPSQSLVVQTRPPHLPLTTLPLIEDSWADDLTWLPQEQSPEIKNSEIYTSLIQARLLLAVLNESQPLPDTTDTGVLDPQLLSLLQNSIAKPFFFIAEYNQEEEVVLGETTAESAFGQPSSTHLVVGQRYQLVAVQVTEYNSVYNTDLRYSSTFTFV